MSEVSFDDGDVPSESSLGEQGEVLCDGPVELTASVSRSRSRFGLSRRMRRDETRTIGAWGPARAGKRRCLYYGTCVVMIRPWIIVRRGREGGEEGGFDPTRQKIQPDFTPKPTEKPSRTKRIACG